jgi:hypothetical protein
VTLWLGDRANEVGQSVPVQRLRSRPAPTTTWAIGKTDLSRCTSKRLRSVALQIALQIAQNGVVGNCEPPTSHLVRTCHAVPCHPVKPPVSLSHG